MALDRREFIRNSTIAGLGLAFLPKIGFANSVKQTLNIGFIGMGLRGEEHLKNALFRSDIQVIAICDIDPNRLKVGREMIEEKGKSPALEFGRAYYD